MLRAVGRALFSSGYQNPKFSPVETKAQDYEVRTYHAAKWISTSVSGANWDEAMSTGFRRLFKYIQGHNQSETSVEMTAPVTCRVEPGAGPACDSTFTVSFYIPEELQAEPPAPCDADVFVENRKEFTAYIRTYSGFSKEQMKIEQLQKLTESLQRDAVPFRASPYYAAGYDSPFKLTNRRNEVWMLRESQEE